MHYSTAFFLLPAIVSAATLCPDFKATRCNVTLLNPTPAGYTCSQKGRVSKPSILQKGCTSTLQQCQSQCINTPKCYSFGYNSTGTGTCTLYNKLIKQMGYVIDKQSKTSFSNRNCFSSTACPPQQVTPACSNQFYIKAANLNTPNTRYIGISEYSDDEVIGLLGVYPWSFRLDNSTSQLVAADSCHTEQEYGCFTPDGLTYPTHIYSGTSAPSTLFMGQPSTPSAKKVICAFSGSDGKTLKCAAASTYNQFVGCFTNDNPTYPEASLAQGTNTCSPFTAQVVCPLPATCLNGFYLQTQGAQAGTAAGKWVTNVNSNLQVTANTDSRTLFKLGDPDSQGAIYRMFDATTGEVAIALEGPDNGDGGIPSDVGYAPVKMIPGMTRAPEGSSTLRCRFNGEELECSELGRGSDFAVGSQSILEIGRQQPSTDPRVGLKVVCK